MSQKKGGKVFWGHSEGVKWPQIKSGRKQAPIKIKLKFYVFFFLRPFNHLRMIPEHYSTFFLDRLYIWHIHLQLRNFFFLIKIMFVVDYNLHLLHLLNAKCSLRSHTSKLHILSLVIYFCSNVPAGAQRVQRVQRVN